MSLNDLPAEIIQYIAFCFGILSIADIASLARVCRHTAICLVVDSYGSNIHKAMCKALYCAQKGWWTAIRYAINRGWYVKGPPIEQLFETMISQYDGKAEQEWSKVVRMVFGFEHAFDPVNTLLTVAKNKFLPRWFVQEILSDSRTIAPCKGTRVIYAAFESGNAVFLSTIRGDERFRPILKRNWGVYAQYRFDISDRVFVHEVFLAQGKETKGWADVVRSIGKYGPTTMNVDELIECGNPLAWKYAADWVMIGLDNRNKAFDTLRTRPEMRPWIPIWLSCPELDLVQAIENEDYRVDSERWFVKAFKDGLVDVVNAYLGSTLVNIYRPAIKKEFFDALCKNNIHMVETVVNSPQWKPGSNMMVRALAKAIAKNHTDIYILLKSKLDGHSNVLARARIAAKRSRFCPR